MQEGEEEFPDICFEEEGDEEARDCCILLEPSSAISRPGDVVR